MEKTEHKASTGGVLPFGETFFNISIQEHGHTGLSQVPARVLPMFNINQPSQAE